MTGLTALGRVGALEGEARPRAMVEALPRTLREARRVVTAATSASSLVFERGLAKLEVASVCIAVAGVAAMLGATKATHPMRITLMALRAVQSRVVPREFEARLLVTLGVEEVRSETVVAMTVATRARAAGNRELAAMRICVTGLAGVLGTTGVPKRVTRKLRTVTLRAADRRVGTRDHEARVRMLRRRHDEALVAKARV